MNELKKYSTAQLVKELNSRAEVDYYQCDCPHSDVIVEITDRRLPGIQKTTRSTHCDVLLISLPHYYHHENDEK